MNSYAFTIFACALAASSAAFVPSQLPYFISQAAASRAYVAGAPFGYAAGVPVAYATPATAAPVDLSAVARAYGAPEGTVVGPTETVIPGAGAGSRITYGKAADGTIGGTLYFTDVDGVARTHDYTINGNGFNVDFDPATDALIARLSAAIPAPGAATPAFFL